ncbi:MAG: hypothetical protein AAGF85_03940 [Bacteroidota bacterium]
MGVREENKNTEVEWGQTVSDSSGSSDNKKSHDSARKKSTLQDEESLPENSESNKSNPELTPESETANKSDQLGEETSVDTSENQARDEEASTEKGPETHTTREILEDKKEEYQSEKLQGSQQNFDINISDAFINQLNTVGHSKALTIDNISYKVDSFAPSKSNSFPKETIKKYALKLKKERVLLVCSPGYSVEPAKQAIGLICQALEAGGKTIEKREIRLKHSEFIKQDVEIDVHSLADCFKETHNLLFYFNSNETGNLLATRLSERSQHEFDSQIQLMLNAKDRFIVCVTKEPINLQELRNSDSVFKNSFWILGEDKSLARKKKTSSQGEERSRQTTQKLFEESTLVHQIVLFVATYFGKIDSRGFDTVVHFFLEAYKERPIEIRRREVRRDVEGREKLDKKGNLKVDHILDKISPEDYWKANKSDVYEKCLLIRKKSEESKEFIIDFEEDSRQEIEWFFESRKFAFLEEQLQVIEHRGMLFLPNLSHRIIECVISLTIKVIQENPQYYPKTWLAGYMSSILKSIEKHSLQTHVNHQKESESIHLWHAFLMSEELKTRYIYRLVYLLLVFMENSSLRVMVKEFLEKLIDTDHYDKLLIVIPFLANSLKKAPEYNTFYWYQRLLDQDNIHLTKLSEKINKDLLNPRDEIDWEQTVQAVKKWLPKSSTPSNELTGSNHYAMKFITQHYIRTLIWFPKDNYGKEPQSFPGFLKGDDTGEELSLEINQEELLCLIRQTGKLQEDQELLDLYGNVLLYLSIDFLSDAPRFTNFYPSGDIRFLHADILEGWLAILHGWHETIPSEKVDHCATAIIETLISELSKKDLEAFAFRWQRRVELYNRILAELNSSSAYKKKKNWREIKQTIKNRRNVIRNFNRLVRAAIRKL